MGSNNSAETKLVSGGAQPVCYERHEMALIWTSRLSHGSGQSPAEAVYPGPVNSAVREQTDTRRSPEANPYEGVQKSVWLF